MMDFTKNIFITFENTFGGSFYNMLPDETPVYEDKKGNIYFLDENTEKLAEKSINEKINFLLDNNKFIPDSNLFY